MSFDLSKLCVLCNTDGEVNYAESNFFNDKILI